MKIIRAMQLSNYFQICPLFLTMIIFKECLTLKRALPFVYKNVLWASKCHAHNTKSIVKSLLSTIIECPAVTTLILCMTRFLANIVSCLFSSWFFIWISSFILVACLTAMSDVEGHHQSPFQHVNQSSAKMKTNQVPT